MRTKHLTTLRQVGTLVGGLMLLASLSGCQLLGYVASTAPRIVKAQYDGLKGQKVAVMVWVDDGLAMDWGTKLQTDLAGAVQNQLTASKADELEGTTWPHTAAAIVAYQLENKALIETLDIRQVAPKIQGITRLIYIELEAFATRSYEAVELYRGSASATVKVLEIVQGPKGREARIVYTESGVHVVFPPKTPPEGRPDLNPDQVYVGTVSALAVELANRFMEHEEPR